MPSGSWPFPSPLLPPTPLTGSLPPLSPLPGFLTPNTTCTAGFLTPGQLSHTSVTFSSPHYFQWPIHYSSQSNRVQHELPPPYHQAYHKIEHSSSTGPANLPDFDTVFTTLSS